VVIYPKYRTIGVGSKLIRETLPLVGTPYAEMVAAMAKYNQFAERAGLQKIVEQKPLENVQKISNILVQFGFNLPLLGSERHGLEKQTAQASRTRSAQRSLHQKHVSALPKRVRDKQTPTIRQNSRLRKVP